MLFVEDAERQRIDSQRIGTEMPGDRGCRHLRIARHDRSIGQACSEGFDRFFRETNYGPGTTSKHVHFLFLLF